MRYSHPLKINKAHVLQEFLDGEIEIESNGYVYDEKEINKFIYHFFTLLNVYYQNYCKKSEDDYTIKLELIVSTMIYSKLPTENLRRIYFHLYPSHFGDFYNFYDKEDGKSLTFDYIDGKIHVVEP